MKQELNQIFRKLISELEENRAVCVNNMREYWVDADKYSGSSRSAASFEMLNIEKNEFRRINKKLKKLRVLQTKIKNTICLIHAHGVINF